MKQHQQYSISFNLCFGLHRLLSELEAEIEVRAMSLKQNCKCAIKLSKATVDYSVRL